ncbi:MAG: hypothetical protein J6Z35_12155 [Lachnospiraceae bacterium]|nr:hypothetical protein [Lachnospiraceae bacterium]
MIDRNDILSMEYLKKTEFTGSHAGMRYRLEGIAGEDGNKKLKVTVWPEPFNFFMTPDDQKQSEIFDFNDDGVEDAVRWMNARLFEDKEKWEEAPSNWDHYVMP